MLRAQTRSAFAFATLEAPVPDGDFAAKAFDPAFGPALRSGTR